MKHQERVLTTLLLLTAGCFSPRVSDETEAAESSATTGTTSEGTDTTGGSAGQTDATSSGGGSSGDDPPPATSDTADDATRGEGSATTDDTAMPDTDVEDPFCGDGVVDDDEECDDGLRNNGLDQSCLPDCNLNVCGDSNVGQDEACDEGEDDNILEPGACAPDCSGVIETREIVISDFAIAEEDGNFGPNPLATADAMCPSGYDALINVPGERQVTNTPNQADAVGDWPLRPYTAYVDQNGELVWVTDSAPLLGVREGIPAPLLHPMSPSGGLGVYVATGMNQDWTANVSENCSGFGSSSSTLDLRYGTASSDSDFLSGFVATPCNDTAAQVICVEQ